MQDACWIQWYLPCLSVERQTHRHRWSLPFGSIVIYRCVTSYPNLSGLKQQMFITSQFCLTKNQEVAWLRASGLRFADRAVAKLSVRAAISAENSTWGERDIHIQGRSVDFGRPQPSVLAMWMSMYSCLMKWMLVPHRMRKEKEKRREGGRKRGSQDKSHSHFLN